MTSKAITFIVDTDEDQDILDLIGSTKKSRRSALIRELLRLGWKVKHSGNATPHPEPPNSKTSDERKEPNLDLFHDEN